MKTLIATLIVLAVTSSMADARTHCYTLDGKMVCCVEGKTVTTCF